MKKHKNIGLVFSFLLVTILLIGAISGTVMLAEEEFYLKNQAQKEKELDVGYQRIYSVYALSDRADDYRMDEITKSGSNFRYGIIARENLEGLDLQDLSNYEVQNFDADFDAGDVYIYSATIGENSDISYHLSLDGSAFISANVKRGGAQDPSGEVVPITEIVYDWNTGIFYFQIRQEGELKLYPCQESISLTSCVTLFGENEGTYVDRYEPEDAAYLRSYLSEDKTGWRSENENWMLTFGTQLTVLLSDVKVCNNLQLPEYGKVESGPATLTQGSLQLWDEEAAREEPGQNYYVLSYVAKSTFNKEAGDLFAQIHFLVEWGMRLRYLPPVCLVVFGLLWLWLFLVLSAKVMRFGVRSVKALVFSFRGNVSLLWRGILAICVLTIFEFMVGIGGGEEGFIVLLILEKIVVYPLLFLTLLHVNRLQKESLRVAQGDLTEPVNTSFMLWDFKRIGENINAIEKGMSHAVEERMKSERFKTELITNVSHDIKTPLTSIINYVDLLSKEDLQNEKADEYLEVLNRQSARLKKLIEDLMEASKASTGNLKCSLQPLDAGVILQQMMGEYEEKLQTRNVQLITKTPDESVQIMADVQYFPRVIDNLMSNIFKYGQEGTRAYVNLEKDGDSRAVITFRNTSGAPLNITSEELLQRFTRGDASRNTEGSGLGLSIAQSLTELMGGELVLVVDGDLFKVQLIFPSCAETSATKL